MERYFFEIPVYRTREQTFYQEREKRIEKYLDDLVKRNGGITREQSPDTFLYAEERLRQQYGAWNFNQAIGWIRLYILGDQIRGEYWFIDSKQIRYNITRKQFFWQGKAFELFFFPYQSSSDIYKEICDSLEQLRLEKPFKGRFIDLSSFYNIGSFVDWRRVISLNE